MILQPNFARPWDMSTESGHRLSLGLAPLQAIRCTMPACPCECFLPGKTQTRQCETCKHGWVPHALDKLGLRPVQHCWSSGGALSASQSGPVEPVLPNTVFDVASLALYGCQAVPIRLKILLDRLFSVLNTEDIIQVLTAFGWTLEDYAKGYMLQDMQGRALETWTVCTKEEEPLVLQQFLRFGETRAIAARILQQHQQQLQQLQQQQENQVRERDSRDRDKVRKHSGEEHREATQKAPKIDTDIKKFLDKTKPSPQAGPPTTTPAPPASTSAPASSAVGAFSSAASSMPPPPGFTCPPGLASLPFPLLPGLSALSGPLARFPGLLPIPPSVASLSQHMRLPSSGLASLPLSPPIQSSVPLSVAQSPLGRLQGMQPFDFRKSEAIRDSRSPPERKHSNSAPGVNSSTSVTYTSSSLTAPVASPLCLTKSQSAAPANQTATSRSRSPSASSSSELDWDDDMDQDDMDDVYDAQNALNLTRDKATGDGADPKAKRFMDGPLAARGLPDISDSLNDAGDKRMHALQRRDVKAPGGSPVKRSWNPLGPLGTQLINPATGKKRVQCNVCLKTFCDKGALKIHFSAVHLREMHKCTVEGCNMMFSSRRSRNRHSANPNPKLHSPHLRRKISPHDGRTSQPHPILLSQGLGLTPPGIGPFGAGLHPHPSLGSLAPLGLGSLHPDVGGGGLAALNASASASGASSGAPERPVGGASNNHSVSSLSSGGGDTPIDRNGVPLATNQRPPYFASSDEEDDDVDDDVDDLDDLDDDRLSPLSAEAEDDERRQRPVPPPKIPPSASGAPSGRKRKSQNPTRLLQVEERNVSSDDEEDAKRRRRAAAEPEARRAESSPQTERAEPKNGLPSAESSTDLPQQHEAARQQSGVENGVNGHADGHADGRKSDADEPKASNGTLDSNILRHLEHLAGNGLRLHLNDKLPKSDNVSEDELDDEELDDEDDEDSPLSDSSSLAASFLAGFDVPIDKENPRRCAACGKVFQNHFGVKTHYQNVHLKLMHKCTVDGCQAAFPSKRSRDRHAANLNLHRKLLSTSAPGSAGQSASAPTSPTEADGERKNDFFGGLSALNGALRDELLSRIYANAEASMMGLTPFLPPPPSLFMPGLAHAALPAAASAFLRHHNNNNSGGSNNGKNSMETTSPPPSSPSDRPDEESAATPPPSRSPGAAVYPCTVDNCTKIFVSPHLRNAHCQDDHDNSAAVRNSI